MVDGVNEKDFWLVEIIDTLPQSSSATFLPRHISTLQIGLVYNKIS